jgi:hypothetical protein
VSDIIVCRHVQTREIAPQVLFGEDGEVQFAGCYKCASEMDDFIVADPTTATANTTHCKPICAEHAAEMGVPAKMPGQHPVYEFYADAWHEAPLAG